MERLSPLETAFLALESREVPFVFASVIELDRPLELAALRTYMTRALVDLPRYKQRIVRSRLGAAGWRAEEGFRIDRQVRIAKVAAPGGPHELDELVAQLLAAQLPLEHAPWRLYTVHGLAGGRGALIALVHHALVDGVAGFRLLEYLLRVTPAAPHDVPPASPRQTSLRELFAWKHVTALARLLRQGVSPASNIGLNPRHVSATRTVASLTVPLDEVRRIEHAYGVTNNDVVLATVAGALGRFVARRGIVLGHARDVRAMVPVARHGRGEHATAGNRVALLLAALPIHIADPDRRLARVAASTRALKRGHTAAGGDLLVALSGATTPWLLASILGLALRVRAFNTIVTNVPGPRAPLSLLGARVERIVPIVNLWPHQALGIAVASYVDKLTFGFNADPSAIRDLAVLRDDFAAAFEELVQDARSNCAQLAGDEERRHA